MNLETAIQVGKLASSYKETVQYHKEKVEKQKRDIQSLDTMIRIHTQELDSMRLELAQLGVTV